MKRIFFITLTLLMSLSVFAQDINPMAPMENDPSVRVGKLANGMTYYIMHNDKPEDRAEFYLVTNVGAIQETPAQDGLAHFLEHMCFNGTKNFPDKGILDYCQSIGAEFGRNINAGTGVEQTSYMLNNMPVIREGIVDSCLLILHDYSAFVLNKPEEIDKERGVIIEEWRTRRTADWRMHEKSLPYLYGDSKYSTCTVIGSKENLETFKPEELVNFYKTWYRPDLQALIVVGDIDVDHVEKKIQDLFSDIPARENPEPKVLHQIPNNDTPSVGIITDPEATTTTVQVYFKSDPMPTEMKNTGIYFLTNLMQRTISTILRERFSDIAMQPESPFTQAGCSFSSLCVTKDAFFGYVAPKEDKTMESFNALMFELEKAKRYGFTSAEFERAKANILSGYEAIKNAASTRKNSHLVYPLMGNFLDNTPYSTPEYTFDQATKYMSMLTVEQINQAMAMSDYQKNAIIIYNAPEKEGITHPTQEELSAVLANLPNLEIEAPAQEESNLTLLDETLLKGSKVKKEKEGKFETTVWTLKNGIEVILKPTEFQKDRISLNISNKGGNSLIETEKLPSIESNIFYSWMGTAGLGALSATDLQKALTGKNASAEPFISSLTHGVSGATTKKDFETMLQLAYLYYTAPRFEEQDYDVMRQGLESILPNYVKQPDYQFQKFINEVLFENNPRSVIISLDVFEKANLADLEAAYRQLFSNAKGAVVRIIGDFDIEEVRPLVEKYIGSLPTSKKATKWVDHNMSVVKGEKEATTTIEMTTPKSTSYINISADMPYTLENIVTSAALDYIMDMVYTKTIREDEGGTYGVSCGGNLTGSPKERYNLRIMFDTNAESVEKLTNIAITELERVAKEGPTQEHLDMAKENFLKNISESRINNGYWSGAISMYKDYGIDKDTDYEKVVSSLTIEKVKTFIEKVLSQGNNTNVIMLPKESKE